MEEETVLISTTLGYSSQPLHSLVIATVFLQIKPWEFISYTGFYRLL